ncbi:hypothetical protein MJO29_015842 [Puccinia striiformis f. sp. tritici]|uniref:Uncharacterized protein n=1 Tax=Puccinia striiformis f. sp. tritici PST-78 TaxID=1165861 RepID=A0A0L0V6B6_9BASI|nr:hypothetical protein MJO29_015842 [Puccinia striiformis f. sp. tritici]KNE94813.1 hypothetical protein PSTG_11824 [Puccinia striiformis f. sp. tritici PST-78]
MTLNIPGDRELMQSLSNQVRDTLPTDNAQSTNSSKGTNTPQHMSQPVNPTPSQNQLHPKTNPSRKARPTRATTKAQQQAQGTEDASETGDTQMSEPSNGVSNTLGASHFPGAAIAQSHHGIQPIAKSGPTMSNTSTMDNLIKKLIQAQEDGRDEADDRYFKLIEMMTVKNQADPQPQTATQQQTSAVVSASWNIMEMRGIIPITIYNHKWQEEALAYHAYYRPKEENSSEKGMTVTLKKYGYDTLIEWLAIHVGHCEKLRQKNGFIVALRYDVRVRRNAIAFRAESGGSESLSDFSTFKPQTAKEVYAEARNFNELGFGDINPYAKGEA